ncbi:ornithine carbamoyltransferase [Methylocystis sp.]|uniref:ornithine carbamoyltransferase n=1 Tax=Methylocystis sp. TaxID=1911079 RepID=UPI003DA2A580
MRIATRSFLVGRSFVKEADFTVHEWRELLELAAELKAEKHDHVVRQRLAGKNLALLVEKASIRSRCAFEVAAYDEGAHVSYLDLASSPLGHQEPVADLARVLGRTYDGIGFSGSDQGAVELLAEHAGVPVWNASSDQWHPTQSLADTLTMSEHVRKPLRDISFAYVGDARSNVANSLLVTGAMLGMDVRMVAPQDLWNPADVRREADRYAAESGASLRQTEDIADGVRGVDFVCTDAWVETGQSVEVWRERVQLLAPYQVNQRLLDLTGNPEVRFMHRLPAFHDRGATVDAHLHEATGMRALEVTDDVFGSTHSIVFDQAENQMHAIKAVMVATLGER